MAATSATPGIAARRARALSRGGGAAASIVPSKTRAYSKTHPVLAATGPICVRASGGSRARTSFTRDSTRARIASRSVAGGKRISTYAIPAIETARTAVERSVGSSALVNTDVTRTATSLAGCPIQSTESTTWGSASSGRTSRFKRRRPASATSETNRAAASTTHGCALLQASTRRITA